MSELINEKLSNIADVKLCNVDKKTKENEIPIQLCNYMDVYRNSYIDKYNSENFMYASCTKNEYEKFVLKSGQVAITKDSEKANDIGIPTYIDDDLDNIVLGYHLSLVTPNKDKLDGKFLKYWLETKQAKKYFENNALGSGQRLFLTLNSIKDTPLHLPKLSTQKNISNILFNFDKKIELNNQINQKLEAMAKMLYDYWFVQFDFPDAHGKPYKSSGGKMVYSEELKREIPEGWEVGTLLDIATYTNGLACQKYRPTNDEYLPVIKIREMKDGFTKNTEKVKKDIPEKLIVNDGDILFSWSASLEVIIWTGGQGGLNQHIFKVTSDKYPRSFYYFQLMWYLQHFKMMAELRKTTMGHITQDHLKQSRIVIPPLELIEKLDAIIKPLQEKQVLLKQETQKLTQLRDWLLPMLMNGQVKVLEADDMVQEALMAAEPKVEYGKDKE